MSNPDCIFCKIVANQSPSYKVYEDETHLAFLDIFPETSGQTVVIPKKHYTSSLTEVDQDILKTTVVKAQEVAKKLKQAYRIDWVAMTLHGVEVHHFHVVLRPIHKFKVGSLSRLATPDQLDQTLTLIQKQTRNN